MSNAPANSPAQSAHAPVRAVRRAVPLAAFSHTPLPPQPIPPTQRTTPPGLILTEGQIVALERAKQDKEAHGEIETEHPGYLGSQDTFYVGTLKGVGRI